MLMHRCSTKKIAKKIVKKGGKGGTLLCTFDD